MRSCWRGVTIVAMDDDHGARPFRADLVVEDDHIAEVRERFGVDGSDAFDRVIEANRLVAVPGYVNAHVHSWEGFFKGRYDNLPLELWMLRSYPPVGLEPMPIELIRLRTLLVALESLKNGVTCLLDDVIEMPGQSLESLDAVMSAYEECGIRANCSGHIVNKPFIDTLPFVDEVLPAKLLAELRALPVPTTEQYLEFSREAFRRYHGRSGRLRYVIAPSGPQRCTDDLLVAAHELAAQWDASYHIHVLETRVQAVTAREFYGSTLVEHMQRIGALSDRVTLGHGIWLTPGDIALLADTGTSIAHNPVSNLKLDSGVLAWRALPRRAGERRARHRWRVEQRLDADERRDEDRRVDPQGEFTAFRTRPDGRGDPFRRDPGGSALGAPFGDDRPDRAGIQGRPRLLRPRCNRVHPGERHRPPARLLRERGFDPRGGRRRSHRRA